MAGLHVTPAMIEAVYELLRTTPPFRGWKLPHADDVEFGVTQSHHFFGVTRRQDGKFSVHVSCRKNKQLGTLIATVAHEMIHIRQGVIGEWHGPDHGKTFHRMADQVCRWHQFDRGAF